MFRDKTLIPTEAIRVLALGLIADRPRRYAYVPWVMRFSPLLETGFGWLIDRLGPLLLKRSVKA